MAKGRHLENRYDVITQPPMVRFGWICYADAESHADDIEIVKMETGNRISIWRPFVFRNWK